ncbi:MAG: hypothetical protein K5634_05815 [Sphaerochaetaceae bacterium]|nr:hypothetical protein [Sphaerochaetaceae bacterium]
MNFICLILCFRFVLSRNGLTWITSLVITVAFMAVSFLLLLAIVTPDTTVEVYSLALSIAAVNSVISVFWTATILLFRYILTPTERDEMYRRQNLYEIMLKLKKKHPGKTETKEGEVHTQPLVQPENNDSEE